MIQSATIVSLSLSLSLSLSHTHTHTHTQTRFFCLFSLPITSPFFAPFRILSEFFYFFSIQTYFLFANFFPYFLYIFMHSSFLPSFVLSFYLREWLEIISVDRRFCVLNSLKRLMSFWIHRHAEVPIHTFINK